MKLEARMEVAVIAIGGFSLALGVWHLGVPAWFHFGRALDNGARLPSVRAVPVRYGTTPKDVLGVAWIMNLVASYGLITIGIAGLAAPLWVGTTAGRVVAIWIAGWWFVRAAAQLAMGHRKIDVMVMAWFAVLGAVAVAAGVA
jgi:hypothetical protein